MYFKIANYYAYVMNVSGKKCLDSIVINKFTNLCLNLFPQVRDIILHVSPCKRKFNCFSVIRSDFLTDF